MISVSTILILSFLLMFHAVMATFAKMLISDFHIKFFNYTKANWKYFKYFVAIPGVPFIYMAIFFAIIAKDAWSEFSRE